MDDQSTVSDELLDEAYCELPLTGEYIENMCLNNGISNDSESNSPSTHDGFTMPITLVLPESEVTENDDEDDNEDGGVILMGSESFDDDDDDAKDDQEEEEDAVLEIGDCQVSEPTLKTDCSNVGSVSGKPQTATVNKKVMFLSEAKKSSASISETAISSTNAKKLASEAESLKHQLDLHTLETTTRLEDFMDVVTTYKCKFCRFSCPWRSGLMSHIRNCHIEAAKKSANLETEVHNYALDPKNSCVQKKSKKLLPLEEHGYSQSPLSADEDDPPSQNSKPNPDANHATPPVEKHVFLCGECSEGFAYLEDCKNHMIKDHELKLESSAVKGKVIGVPRRRGRPRTRPLSLKDAGSTAKEPSTIDDAKDSSCDSTVSSPQKRQSRPPKVLQEDYYMEGKKRRALRDSGVEKPYKCEEIGCGYRFSSVAHLHYHTTCHSPYSEKSFICPECGETSENWRSLSVHLWKEHTIDVDLYTCGDCGYKTYSLFKLDNHKKIHSDERNFICKTCGKGFKQLSQLRNHVVIHTDRKNMVEKRWYSEQKCEICNRTFSDSKCLKKHQQAVHSKLKPFICTYCGHMSARKAMLQLHMRQHTGEKPFTCEHCEYRTGDHNSLRRHRMRHTGLKPYKCPHCPYACIQAISYKTHLKNKHPGLEGLYACSLCPFRSVSKDNFFNHMSDHRRGAIPGIPDTDVDSPAATRVTTENIPQPAEMHLPDNTLQQLEGILPGNMTAAQLIYSCLNALSQENGSIDLPPGVTTASMSDGTQTITIQIPSSQEVHGEQFFLTVEDESTSNVPTQSAEKAHKDGQGVNEEMLHPITVIEEGGSESQSLDSGAFNHTEQDDANSVESSSLIIAQVESEGMFAHGDTSNISGMVHCDV